MHLRDILPGCPVPFANNPEVDRFEFGSRYAALMLNGARVEFTDFEAAIGAMAAALRNSPTADVVLRIEANHLVARVEVQLGRPWGRDTEGLLQRIRFAIGHFMMTDTWPEDIPRRSRRDKIQFGR